MNRNNIVKCVGIMIAVLLVGIGIGRFALPNSKTTTEETSKETETEREVIDRTRTNPDGSKETEHIVKDTKKKKEETSKTVIVENKKPDWKVAALAGYSFRDKDAVYGVSVDRRILGAVSVGVFGMTNRTVGLSVGYEF